MSFPHTDEAVPLYCRIYCLKQGLVGLYYMHVQENRDVPCSEYCPLNAFLFLAL
jgi:hypothetical protein